MSTRTFPVEWLERNHIAVNGMSRLVVHREFEENQEYGALWSVVFTDEDRYWRVTYQTPLGEAHADTWFDDLEIIATEVRPQAKFVTEWVPVRPHDGGKCAERVTGSTGKASTCDLDAPFIIAMASGNEVASHERCAAHTRMILNSPQAFHLVQEVRRRWR